MTARFALVTAMLLMPSLLVAQARPWEARVRLASVSPDDSSSVVPGTGVQLGVDRSNGLEIDLAHVFPSGWGLELSWLRTKVDTVGWGQSLPEIKTGDVQLSLATLMLQYHPLTIGHCRPYLGVGAHLASFGRHDSSAELVETGIAAIAFDDDASVTAQLGADFDVSERFTVNVDVKYHDVATNAALKLATGATFDTIRLDVDPWVFAVGAGFRF